MAEWQILTSFMAAIPKCLVGDSIADVQAHMQVVADSKRRDPKIGPLTFKDFVVDGRREVHGFFINRRGKKIRFMKVVELHSRQEAV